MIYGKIYNFLQLAESVSGRFKVHSRFLCALLGLLNHRGHTGRQGSHRSQKDQQLALLLIVTYQITQRSFSGRTIGSPCLH